MYRSLLCSSAFLIAAGFSICFYANQQPLQQQQLQQQLQPLQCPDYDFGPASEEELEAAQRRWQHAHEFVLKRALTFLNPATRDLHRRLMMRVEKEGVPGIVLEAGVAKAGSAIMLAALKRKGRCLHLYDTFQGMPPPSGRDGQDVHKRYHDIKAGREKKDYYGYMKDLMSFDQRMFQEAGEDSSDYRVFWHKGLFNETLWLTGPVAYAHLDGDWYDSVMQPLTRVVPHLSVGGIIIFDDCAHYSGARHAMEDFFGITFSKLALANGVPELAQAGGSSWEVLLHAKTKKVYARKTAG